MFLGYNRRAAEIKKANKDNIVPENNQPSEDEYVWVDGYKGMDKDMKCYGGFQYQLGGHYQIDNDPVLCKNGFHLCLNLCEVFSYYKPFGGNRFFKVRALVKKKDLDRYGYVVHYDMGHFIVLDKIVSKQIDILEEMVDEYVLRIFFIYKGFLKK